MMTLYKRVTSQLHLADDLERFVREQLLKSYWLLAWVIILALITVQFIVNRLNTAPLSTIIVLLIWAVSVIAVIVSELFRKHTRITLWLKNNLYNSITNTLISLIATLGLIVIANGFYHYAWTTASFTTYPATDIRARLESSSGQEYCFTIGGIDPDVSGTEILDGKLTCFEGSQLSTSDFDTTLIGSEAASFCFDVMPDDPDNGIFCFDSSEDMPDFFVVTRTFSGANWGAVAANMTNLMIFRFDRQETWRLWANIIMLVVLAVPSFFVYSGRYNNRLVRRALTGIWLLTPIFSYILLRGIPETNLSTTGIVGIVSVVILYFVSNYVNNNYLPGEREPEWLRLSRYLLQGALIVAGILAVLGILNLINFSLGSLNRTVDGTTQPLFKGLDPDVNWGGFLLTVVIAIFAIVVSFPLGIMLALARRSQVRGIPAWLIYLVAAIITIWGLMNSTPPNLEAARNTFEKVLAFWPLLVPVIAYLFQRTWKGNVFAGFSTLYIEFVRGIPFIAVLFMTIVLFPILLPKDIEIATVWRVMWGATFFAAAYLAENVRGGLQSLPKGQYEAADSLGLSTIDKYRLIILPQALRVVIPAIVGQFISLFKDTTLVAIVGFLDILGVANSISAQPAWLGVRREAYLFLAVLYFVVSAIMAGYSRRLEAQLGVGER